MSLRPNPRADELHQDICRLLSVYSSVFDRPCVTEHDRGAALNALHGIAYQHVCWLWSLARMSSGSRLLPTDFEARPPRATEDEDALYDEYARCIHRARNNRATLDQTMQTLAALAKRHVYSRDTQCIAMYPNVPRTHWR